MAISTIFTSLLLALTHYFPIFVTSNLSPPIPHCPEKCGNVQITYPFGIGEGCFLSGFEVNCNQSIPFLGRSNLQLLEILPGEVRINSTPFISSSFTSFEHLIKLPKKSPYTFPVNSNKFIVVGCNAWGSISDSVTAINSCISICLGRKKVVNGSCSGYGCCQVDVPSFRKSLKISIITILDSMNLTEFSHSRHGFVVEDGSYNFTASDLLDFNRDIHMKLEWAIGKKNCGRVKKLNSCICGENSSCVNSITGSGYLCRCDYGYQGNPYLNGQQGCQDLDECNSTSSPCVPGAICENRVPGYFCHCPAGTRGNGSTSRNGCHKPHKHFPMVEIVLAAVVSAWLLTTCMYLLYLVQKKRHLKNLNARQNAGRLQQIFSLSKGTAIEHIKIFSAHELKKATSNYDRRRILGSGGQGTVYMGTQEDGSIVAIKIPEEVAICQVDQFINELIILSQIDHKNIVKLLGCCLETPVPLLIYEFISGGTLYQKLHHDPNLTIQLSWKDRLRIAREIADALSYLHSCVSMPIFHRDVKSSNILLDENFTAKLADFGVSRLIPKEEFRVSTPVKGTIGYLDPEYFKTGILTEKSDVYSFGVVLLELLSGRKPVQHQQTRDYSSLVMHFLSYVERGNLLEVLDEGIVREAKMADLLAIAKIARRCLSLKGEERPTMQEVARKLACLG
ncbi:putative wall-associated receptor kinase-like 16 [Magnolia sinica]|uniref:putative wall-associated receptor kinase-like 16 n=1 Tax=Magnolia sinica TaxID=86752 RepID=UPI00265A64F5|nr:putative wall-associated receptor kinase-like 16 [Magnolia sinica]